MTFAVRLLALCALVELCSGAARADSLSGFLGRMRAASGDPSHARFRSIASESADGRVDAIATESDGLRFFTHRCNGTICTGTYFDGHRLFAVNINGTALPQSRDENRYMRGLRTASTLAFLAPTFYADGGRIRDDGTVVVDTLAYRELFVANVDAIPMRVLVNPTTALVARIRDDLGSADYVFGDYQHVGPYRLPYTMRQGADAPQRTIARTRADAPFAPPAGVEFAIVPGAPSMRTDADAVSPSGTCTIEGVEAHCLIDTGNSGLSMSLGLAERLDLQPVGAYDVRGLGSLTTEVVRAGPLLVGNARFGDADYVVLPDIARFGYDLILGADVLTPAGVAIDARTHALWFGAVPPANAVRLPVTFSNFVPVVDVTLGDVPTPLAIDTGDESNINLAYDFYRKHSDLFTATSQQTVAGVGGSSVELVGRIPLVEVGAYRLLAQTIGTTKNFSGTASGHLGAAFLRNFSVVLDYRNETISLLPH